MTNPRPTAIKPGQKFQDEMRKLGRLLRASERPVLILGSGAKEVTELPSFLDFIERVNIPIVTTWGATNFLPLRYPQKLDTFGTHGGRAGNLAIEASDLLLVLGARLETKATGSPPSSFSNHSRKIVVDIDIAELNKFARIGLEVDSLFHGNAIDFFKSINLVGKTKDFFPWLRRCQELKTRLDVMDSKSRRGKGLSPYSLMKKLDEILPHRINIFVDTGTCLPISISSMSFSPERRIFHDLNNTAMGWSIPAAIGGYFAEPDVDSIVVVGDGSMMMGIHDLSTLGVVNKKSKVLLVDNYGHAMIRQTQDQWFDSKYVASGQGTGIYPMEWSGLSKAAGFQFLEVASEEKLEERLAFFLASDKPTMLVAKIDPGWRVAPQTRFGSPVFEMEPRLDLDEHVLLERLRGL
jgi:acetolactate synthase-1/2/3 large subunit